MTVETRGYNEHVNTETSSATLDTILSAGDVTVNRRDLITKFLKVKAEATAETELMRQLGLGSSDAVQAARDSLDHVIGSVLGDAHLARKDAIVNDDNSYEAGFYTDDGTRIDTGQIATELILAEIPTARQSALEKLQDEHAKAVAHVREIEAMLAALEQSADIEVMTELEKIDVENPPIEVPHSFRDEMDSLKSLGKKTLSIFARVIPLPERDINGRIA